MTTWLIYLYRRVRDRPAAGLLIMLLVVLACLLGNATCFWYFEGPQGPEGPTSATYPDLTYGDAIWYSIVSITTIGYGDYFPKTTGGRLASIVFIVLLGLSTFTILLGMIIDWITGLVRKGQLGMGTVIAQDHVLLVNYPSTSRVLQMIEELRSDAQHARREIVVVSDRVEKLPFQLDRVLFIHGSPLQLDTYQRAAVEKATMALILATNYDDTNSDAVVASAATVIDRLNQSIHIVAECLEEKHRMLFNDRRCSAVVPGLRIVGNLLVQEVHDPGICQLVDVITSNQKGHTLFTTRVESQPENLTYCALAKRLIDRGINVLSINRDCDTITDFSQLQVEQGDNIVYITEKRHAWDGLLKLGSG